MKAVTVVLAVVLASAAHGLVTAYKVEPVKAAWSGWTGFQDSVSQVLTINFDELDSTAGAYCELFAGTKGGGGAYHVSVLTYPGATEIATGNAGGNVDHKWVKFNLGVRYPDSVVKGKLLEFRFTRSGRDSVQFYYQDDDPYPYQYCKMIVGGQQWQTLTLDLAMRVYGRMNPVDDVWRACVNHGNWPPPESGGDTALVRAESIGIKWLRDDFGKWEGWEDDTQPAMGIYHRYENRFSMTGILCYGSNDSAISSWSGADSPPNMHPPRNLFLGLTDTNNYWAGYCRSIMGSMPKVKYWEVWPEANTHWFWQDPDTAYYQGSSGLTNDFIDTPRERCSLYVRMCQIAESVAQTLGGDPRRRILGGTPWRMFEWGVDSTGDTIVAPGESWLRHMFDLAEHRYGGVENCFDIVSVHPYMFYDLEANDILHFIEDTFRINLDTARAVMRAAGYPGMELWATEYGWPRWDWRDKSPLTDTLMQADNLCKFYTSAVARQTDPCGGYDRAIWYELTAFRPDTQYIRKTEGFGLLDSGTGQPRLPHSWAMQQVGEQLSDKRCNGRVMTGNTATDSLVRMYEFEDTSGKRTWVCWGDHDIVTIETSLPVRNDEVDTVALAYSNSEPTGSKDAEQTGWLNAALVPRPVIVTETGAASRPDLVVDSVKYFPLPDTTAVRAWVTNRGNRATPRQSPGNQPYPTWAVLYANGDSLSQQVYADTIAVSQRVTFEFSLSIAQPAAVLLAVKVNPAQTYVELGTDDDCGYRLKAQP